MCQLKFPCLGLLMTVIYMINGEYIKDIYLYTLLTPAQQDNISIIDDTFRISTEYYQIIKEERGIKLSLENINASIKLIQVMACRTNQKYSYKLLNEEYCKTEDIQDSGARIPLKKPLRYPFTTLVNISSSCSGVAISYNYVLTTAQCVYFNSYRNPKLYINDTQIEFEKIFLPTEWLTKTVLSEKFLYNYALIKLKTNHITYTPIHLNMPTSHTSECNSRITLAGYSRKTNKNNITLYKSQCKSSHETDKTIWMGCENSVHDSGNALFGRYENKQGRISNVVRGILIGNYGKYYLRNKLKDRSFNVALRINYEIYLRVCYWMNKLEYCRAKNKNIFPLRALSYFNWNSTLLED